jgi:tetratricopeptide (TPR) repeat protein
MRKGLVASFCLIATSSFPALAQHDSHQAGRAREGSHKLGTIVFPNSGSRDAQAPFLRGIALLHSFEYLAAAAAFREAQRADPTLALAYWGEALTYSHVLWRTEDLAASRAVLRRLAATPTDRLAKARTPRERAFGAAVEAFFEEGSLPQRVGAYADAMRRHALAAPDDNEATAFAAHAIMLAGYQAENTTRDSLFKEAMELAQKVATANPDHPGATHYLIHLYDSPGMAKDGLAFARAYDKIAPDAEHALHMPSHIYLQLGLWDDVARSNERAWAASRASTDNAGQLDWHAFSWLHYAYLQQGRWKAARGLIDTARTLLARGSEGYADASFVITRLEFQQAAETGMWQRPLTRPAMGSAAASDRERAFRQFANYWLAIDAAQRQDTALAALGATYMAIADSVRAGLIQSQVRASNALVVHALVARSRGDTTTALRSLRTAAQLEAKLGAFVGPPERVFPAELWTLELLRATRSRRGPPDAATRNELVDAIHALENVLRVCPNRSQTLFFLATAKTTVGDTAGAAKAFDALRKNWPMADAELLTLLP